MENTKPCRLVMSAPRSAHNSSVERRQVTNDHRDDFLNVKPVRPLYYVKFVNVFVKLCPKKNNAMVETVAFEPWFDTIPMVVNNQMFPIVPRCTKRVHFQ